MGVVDLIWLIILVSALQPMLQQQTLRARRVQAIRRLEKRRSSRVITLIHRQEQYALFGLTFARFDDIEDSEEVLRAIELTDTGVPIDLVVHTPGGLALSAEQIAHALLRHPARVTVIIPHYAMSGGTLIALSADEIMLSPSAVLGPLDPQVGRHPAASIMRVLERKEVNQIEDETLILADMASKATDQMREAVTRLLTRSGMDTAEAGKLAETLTEGQWTHDYPIMAEAAKEMGLPVTTEPPPEVSEIIRLFPQARNRRPSVEYIPSPYTSPPSRGATPTGSKSGFK